MSAFRYAQDRLPVSIILVYFALDLLVYLWAASRNVVDSKWLNILTGNIGYHTAHHHKCGLHWSKLPELHRELAPHIPDYCYTRTVPIYYWIDQFDRFICRVCQLFRHRPRQRPEQDYFSTADGDELELFWYRPNESDTLVIFTHGLESHAKDGPLLRFAHEVAGWGYHTLNWSMRSCGKQLNHTRWFYLGHDYQDLKALADHYSQHYRRIYLVSVSLGGTITANYLGKEGAWINPAVKGAFLLSSPLELDSFHASMTRPINHWLYQRHFVRSLLDKFERKTRYINFGEGVDLEWVRDSRNVDQIEDRLFAPMHGFASSKAYRQHASSLPHLKNITVPTYILTAEDDPFIDNEQLPVDLAKTSTKIYLEITRNGGHTGFVKPKADRYFWYERRFRWFISEATP